MQRYAASPVSFAKIYFYGKDRALQVTEAAARLFFAKDFLFKFIFLPFLYFHHKVKKNLHAHRIKEQMKMKNPKRPLVFCDIPVSKQGQITLPKPIRKYWKIQPGHASVMLILNEKQEISVKPQPRAKELCGAFKKYAADIKPADMYALREEFEDERLRELGYSQKDH